MTLLKLWPALAAAPEEKEDRVLLPIKQVPEGSDIGDWIEVFVYRDSRDRMIATVRDATHADYGAQYVGMLVSVVPMVIVYAFASKIIMEKIAIGAAVKG